MKVKTEGDGQEKNVRNKHGKRKTDDRSALPDSMSSGFYEKNVMGQGQR